MPYVNIKITREGASNQQKQQIMAGVTNLLKDVLGKDPAVTFVVIEEIDTDNWAVAGEQVSLLRKKGK